MKIQPHEMKVRLSDEDTEIAGSRKSNEPSLYAQIRDYPERTVSIPSAYARMYRHPDMTLHDACTAANVKRHNSPIKLIYRGHPFTEQVPQEYVDDLDSDQTTTALAEKWKLSWPTIKRHRKFLQEERDNA